MPNRLARWSAVLCLAFVVRAHAAEPAFRVETLTDGLNFPWGLAFLPNGDMLVTEKLGGVRRLSNGVLLPDPVAGAPTQLQGGDGGLLDIVLDPKFSENGFVYISFAEGTGEANHTALYRGRFDGTALVDGAVIFRAGPDKAGQGHFGSRIAFLPDETLLMTIGDGYDFRDKAQDLSSDLGKIVRLNRDGSIPADNPFLATPGARPEIYAYGHRNPQGLLVDPRDGSVWEHEHGPKGGDEINQIVAGGNYGWPIASYGIDYDDTIITDVREAPGIESPRVVWVPSIAPSGFALYLGDRFPEWNGHFFVGALAAREIRRVRLMNGRQVDQEVLLNDLGARIRDVRAGPDGFIYLLTDEEQGRLLRLVPK